MKYLLLPVLLLLGSCGELPQTTPPTDPAREVGNQVFRVLSAYEGNGANDFYIYTIDSCEYIGNAALNSYAAVLTHKGNCKFCLNRK
jgi:hypothetical protein